MIYYLDKFIDWYYNGGENGDMIGTNYWYGLIILLVLTVTFLSYYLGGKDVGTSDEDWFFIGMISFFAIPISATIFPFVIMLATVVYFLYFFCPWVAGIGERKRLKERKKKAEAARIEKEVKEILGE